MYTLLILFFISLAGIIFMIGRKLALLQNGEVIQTGEMPFQVPYIKEVKHMTIRSIKIIGHRGLVETIRLYVRSSNFLKNRYQEVKVKVRNIRNNNQGDGLVEKKEVSKFLKMVSDYKHKVREIKHKIHEEEKTRPND